MLLLIVGRLLPLLLASCTSPSGKNGEMVTVDSGGCFADSGRVRAEILADLSFDGGLSWVLSNDPAGVFYVRRDGFRRRTHWFDNGPDPFQEGLARLVENGKYGFMDSTLKVVVEPTWDFAFPFSEGRAKVCNGCRLSREGEHSTMVGGIWQVIDRHGRILARNSHPRQD